MAIREIQTEEAGPTFAQAFMEGYRAQGWERDEDAAHYLKVSLRTVANWKNGKTLPRGAELLRVAAVFGWDLPFREHRADNRYFTLMASDVRFSSAWLPDPDVKPLMRALRDLSPS